MNATNSFKARTSRILTGASVCFCGAPLRAAAPEERRLIEQCECTCGRAADAYTSTEES